MLCRRKARGAKEATVYDLSAVDGKTTALIGQRERQSVCCSMRKQESHESVMVLRLLSYWGEISIDHIPSPG